ILASTAVLLALLASVLDAPGESAAMIPPTQAAASTSGTAAMHRFPPGCAVAVDGGRGGARWYMPRASLVVVNRSPHSIVLRMQAWAGTEAAATELGLLDSGETRTFPNAVPAGRSAAFAGREDRGATDLRQPIYIWNQ